MEAIQPSGPTLPVFGPGGTLSGGAPVVLGAEPPPSEDQPFVQGVVQTPLGPVPRVVSRIEWADRLGSWKARWNMGRMEYKVEPGLYALGRPDRNAPVLVSANYKMSFDRLRQALPGRSAWILVLDTDGVNVWCAAGKGTFGTQELIGRVLSSGLGKVVDHRRLILPQLGAPGVSARKVERACGFKAAFGPVRAKDLPTYLDRDRVPASARRVTFTFAERAVVVPIELRTALIKAAPIGLALWLLAGLGWPGGWMANLSLHGWIAVTALAGAVLAGAVFSQLLLPWLPPRAFTCKGFLVSAGLSLAHAVLWWPSSVSALASGLELLGLALAMAGLAGFMAMNFTGSSTYTSLSGVRKEMAWALPLEIVLVMVGLIIWIAARFVA